MCWRTDNAAANSNVQREPCEIWRAQLFSCAPYMIDHMFTQPPAPKHRGILFSFFPWHTTQRQHGTCAKWKRQNGIKGPIYKQPNGRHHYSETEVKLHSEEAMPRWDPGWKTTQFHYGVGGGGACGNSGVLCSETDRERERATDRQTERMELLPYKHVSIISHAHFITAKQNEYVYFSLFSLRWPSKHAMLTPRKKSKRYIYRHSYGACTSYSCSFIQHAYIPENSLYHMKTQGQYNRHVPLVISMNFTRRRQSFAYRKNIDTGLPPTALTEHLIKQKATNLHSFLCTYRQNLNAESETHYIDYC